MAYSSLHIHGPERRQFQALADKVLEVEFLFDPDNILSNGFYTEDVTVPGLVQGDVVIGISFTADIQNLDITAHVKSDGVLSMHVKNNTAGAINLGNEQCHVIILRPNHIHT